MCAEFGLNRERDHRHLLLAQRLGIDAYVARSKFLSGRVLLTGNPETLAGASGPVIARNALNLIARFCPRIDVHLPEESALAAELVALGKSIDGSPHSDFRSIPSLSAGDQYTAVLSVGPSPLHSAFATEVDGAGWLSCVSSEGQLPVLPATWVGPGTLAAAALGAAQIFIRLLDPRPGAAKLSGPTTFSTLTYQVQAGSGPVLLGDGPVVSRIPLPPTLLGGFGAVGQAFLSALLQLPAASGHLWVVDNDRISLTNLNRCVLSVESDVVGRVPVSKAWLAKRSAKGHGIQIRADRRPLQQALANSALYSGGRPAIVICTVDNLAARRELQYLWSDLFLEGSTGDAQIQVLRWEFPANRGCSLCYHGDEGTEGQTGEQLVRLSGLSSARIEDSYRNDQAVVTEADIILAPPAQREFLQERKGRSICGVLTDAAKLAKSPTTPIEPSVSFASFLTGALLASEAVKYACGLGHALDSQFIADTLFPLSRAESVALQPMSQCYCQRRRPTIEAFRKQSQVRHA